jgi:transcriptional regulator with XRE-family HTH domain
MTVRRVALARARKTAGYTQESLAEVLQVERTTVIRWEAGTSEPVPHIRPKLAASLKISDHKLEELLFPAGTSETQHDAALALLSSLISARAGAVPSNGDLDTPVAALHEWVAMNRRELMRLLGLTATDAMMPSMLGLNSDEQARLLGVAQSPERVDAQSIAHIEHVLSAALGNDSQLGPQAALHTVLAQQHLLQAMAPACPTVLRPRLLSVLANAYRIAGWLSFDSLDLANAERYYGQARVTAYEAGNIELAAFVLANMSWMATWTGQPALGLDHAVAAQARALETGDAYLQTFAADVTASAHAAAGSYDLSMRELERAETRLDAAAGQPVGLCYYDHAYLFTKRGGCMVRLARTQEAVDIATKSLALGDSTAVRQAAFTQLYLAKAYTQAKEIGEAATTIGDAAQLATQNRSVRLVKELRATREALEPWRGDTVVVSLDDRLREYGIAK